MFKKVIGGFDMKIDKIFSSLEIMDPQTFDNITIFPLRLEIANMPYFITLDSALKTGKFLIKEVNAFGEVPVLKVINALSEQVLILDGEELKGGKQNRVVNTSILVKKNSELTIPVSCTEAHRWDYTSEDFKDPDVIMPIEIRKKKNETVLQNLASRGEFRSDQFLIWDIIDLYQRAYNVDSETSAMRDVYEKEKDNLENKVRNFPYIEGQNGILVYINGGFEGIDIIPLVSAYKNLHEKLIKSYIFRYPYKKYYEVKEVNKRIFEEISKIEPLKFKSVGLGWDLRYSGKRYIGSILLYKNKPIHINFLRRIDGTMYSKVF